MTKEFAGFDELDDEVIFGDELLEGEDLLSGFVLDDR
jgi:hypothetical protein